MGSLTYGKVRQGMDIPAWLEKQDWTRRYYVLRVGDSTSIPNLIAVQTDGVLTPGETVREHVSRCRPEHLEAINWGNGHFGLSAHDGSALHYILVREENREGR